MATEPELRFLPSGVAVANFRVAASQRKLNQQTNQWEDDKECFLSVTAWRDMAENVVESLHRGDPVLVEGRLSQREYERDGQRQFAYQVDADAVGPDLRYATARAQRTERTQGPQVADPWATPQHPPQQPQQPPQQPQQAQQGWPQQMPQQGPPPQYDEPPFAAPGFVIPAGT
jgi:single-strand DNA-binding protein